MSYPLPEPSIHSIVVEGVCAQIPSREPSDAPPKTEHFHLRWMMTQIASATVSGSKAHRWLGFVQGVLAARGILKIDQERDRTRPYLADADSREASSYVKPKFARGDRVKKKKGSSWRGTVCGEYSTELTPEGYAVESAFEFGSVQIYPAEALELWNEDEA